MSELRKKAMTRLAICAVALVASIIFSVLLLTGTFDGKTDSGDAAPATSDTTSAAAGVNDPTADSFTAEATGDTAEPPAEEQPAEEQPAEPEPTPVPTFDGLSVQPTTYYNEGEQPSYTTPGDSGMNLRAGPGTDYDKVTSVPAGTGVTALGTNEDGSWVVVNYDGKYGWLKTEFLS
ncbi:SH3 domain-containing protein [uncultured Gemmiger sp.]|uniref:SH3 domain-containing protein n=1 Tax=uncultured Gemmiger sp. TaxID=1623490 RepID=UPI00266B9076|nr:SH3 domain-containing protein [uncultured Gemmiger sp.]